MDRTRKRRLLKDWKESERARARAALPLADDVLEALFDYLEQALETQPCDHSRKLTECWLAENGHANEAVLEWLDETGGYCDCEVLANSEGAWRDATGRP
jgi:hypothetical protein